MESQVSHDALICSFSVMTAPRASISQTIAQAPATVRSTAASQTPSDQDEASAQDEETPPAKKKCTPAKFLNEALYLSTREDRNTTAYLDQAKSLLEQGADPKASDAQKAHTHALGGDRGNVC